MLLRGEKETSHPKNTESTRRLNSVSTISRTFGMDEVHKAASNSTFRAQLTRAEEQTTDIL